MKTRRLGNTGLRVSEVALGSWITVGYNVDQATTDQLVAEAFEQGINFFDTADVYSEGEAERLLGKALQGHPRKDYVVASKCFFPTGQGPNDQGLSRKHILESCDASLARLGLEYLDLYQCHRFDPETPLEETLRALDHLVRQGKILYYGVSEWTGLQISDACHIARRLGLYPPVSNQPVYNLLERKIEPQVLPVCRREGLGCIVFSPLAQGVLTGKYGKEGHVPQGTRAADKNTVGFVQRYLTPAALTASQNVVEWARELDVSPAQLALAWCLHRPGITSVIVGARTLDQLRDNAQASSVDLPQEILERLEHLLSR